MKKYIQYYINTTLNRRDKLIIQSIYNKIGINIKGDIYKYINRLKIIEGVQPNHSYKIYSFDNIDIILIEEPDFNIIKKELNEYINIEYKYILL